MEISHGYVVLLLVVAISVSSVKTSYTDRIFSGNESLTNHFELLSEYDYFNRIQLTCLSSSSRIHIDHLELSNPSNGIICNKDADTMQACEGKPRYCTIYYKAWDCPPIINQVNVTFQCIPLGVKLQSMCPRGKSVLKYSQASYFTTPSFTNGYAYTASTICECLISSPSQRSFTTKLLYAQLENNSNGTCIDYISLNTTEKFCNVNSQDNPVTETYSGNSMEMIRFEAGSAVQRRGGWFGIYPDTQYSDVEVSCAQLTRGQTITMTGTAELESYTNCIRNSYISTLNLRCGSSDVIHIAQILFSEASDTYCSHSSTNCTWQSAVPLDTCEGTKGTCTVDVSSRTGSFCIYINQVHVTFQCIASRNIFPMCPSSTDHPLAAGKPAYFHTPGFTSAGGRYANDTRCECTVGIRQGSSVTVSLLYANLERSSTKCYEYVNFVKNGNVGTEYCNEDSLGDPISQSIGRSSSGGFKFVSDSAVGARGAWFEVSPDSSTTLVDISCVNKELHTTTRSHTSKTTHHTTVHPYNSTSQSNGQTSDIGAIVGGVIGGVAFILVVIIVVTCCGCRRRGREEPPIHPGSTPIVQSEVIPNVQASAPPESPPTYHEATNTRLDTCNLSTVTSFQQDK